MIVPVKIVIALYARFRQLIHEVAKSGVIGAVAFAVTWGGTNLLHFGLQMGPLTSNTVATVVAATVAFAGNRYWTFRHRAASGLSREYFLFFVLNGVGLLIQLLCIGFTHYTLKLDDRYSYNVALIVGIALGTLFRFWSYKKWVFLPPQLPAVDARTGLPSPDEVTAPDSLRGTFADGLRGARRTGHATHPTLAGRTGNGRTGNGQAPPQPFGTRDRVNGVDLRRQSDAKRPFP
jgi:putative flippase GtrA